MQTNDKIDKEFRNENPSESEIDIYAEYTNDPIDDLCCDLEHLTTNKSIMQEIIEALNHVQNKESHVII